MFVCAFYVFVFGFLSRERERERVYSLIDVWSERREIGGGKNRGEDRRGGALRRWSPRSQPSNQKGKETTREEEIQLENEKGRI